VFISLAAVNPGTAAFLRCAVALAALVPLMVYETRRHGPMPWRLHRDAALAGLFLGTDYVMWTISIGDVGPGIATVLINVQVIVFPLLALVLDKTPIPRRFLWACPAMLAGVALAGGVLGASGAPHPVRGTVLATAAACAYSGYLYLTRSCGRRSPRHTVGPVCTSTAGAAVAAGLISLLVTGLPLGISTSAWGWITALALLGQVAAWLLIGKGSARLAPSTAAALLLLQPVMALVIAYLVLHETPALVQLGGCALIIGAVWAGSPGRRSGNTAETRASYSADVIGTGEIALDDPRKPDVRELLERHLTFTLGATPPEHSYALDVGGLADPAITFCSFRIGGELLGVGAIKELDPAHGEIKSMHTSEAARGRGIGRAILTHLLGIARERGYERVSLETGTPDVFAAARALYERAGFLPCQPFGGYQPSPDNYFMSLALTPL